jgi:hypothetical protein
MIIDNFYFIWFIVLPEKAYSILIIDPNAILTNSLPFQRFQAIAWRNAQLFKGFDGIQLLQFSTSDAPEILGAGLSRDFRVHAIKNVFRALIMK